MTASTGLRYGSISGMLTRCYLLLVAFVALTACSKKASDVPLKEVRDDAFGYAIRMPDGATQTEHDNGRQVWSWSPDQHVTSYSCIVQHETLDPFTPDAAKKDVGEIRDPATIKSVQALGTDGLLVELAEESHTHYRETWCFRKGKTTNMVAICTGPAAGDTVTAMATSLQATK
jgi:hypothetical protein